MISIPIGAFKIHYFWTFMFAPSYDQGSYTYLSTPADTDPSMMIVDLEPAVAIMAFDAQRNMSLDEYVGILRRDYKFPEDLLESFLRLRRFARVGYGRGLGGPTPNPELLKLEREARELASSSYALFMAGGPLEGRTPSQ